MVRCEKCKGTGNIKLCTHGYNESFGIAGRRKIKDPKGWTGYIKKCGQCKGTGKHEQHSGPPEVSR